MKNRLVYDLSGQFIDYLEIIGTQTIPVIAETASEIIDFIERIEREGFIPPMGLTIDEILIKAINFINARLPAFLRVVYLSAGVFLTTLAYVDLPVFSK